MKDIHASQALLPEGWARDVRLRIDSAGRIAEVTPDSAPGEARRVGLLLPAPVNVHSHAFQRAMAGLTEHRGPGGKDSFWTWRQLMFRFLDRLTPAQVEAITALVQMEMLEAGYGASVEFHYLHHRPGGAPYDDLAEMSARICAGAGTSGMGLCLLPVHYQFGGCAGGPLGPGQIRFGNDLARFQRLHEGAGRHLSALPADATLGAAPHSLRAVAQADLRRYTALYPEGPLHMHLAEQIPEVAEVEETWGARPVTWALSEMALDSRWCLIHCTQMTPEETRNLAQSGAIAGLCPITESNLGDGIFPGTDWLAAGGALAIGSDSNVRISLSEEVRTLDYSQRLRDHSRAALADESRSTGRRLFEALCAGGARAAGRLTGALAPGLWADLLALDTEDHRLAGRQGDALLDTWLFAADDSLVREVWSAGRHLVQQGRHRDRESITKTYRAALAELEAAL